MITWAVNEVTQAQTSGSSPVENLFRSFFRENSVRSRMTAPSYLSSYRFPQGVKIKMDEAGNIMIKRASKSNVYIKEISGGENNSVSADIIRNNGLLEYDKPVKLFDIKKFQQNVSRELKRAYPDRRHLEAQCLSCVCFVKDSPELLDCSIWVMVINIVALELLKTKLPPPMSKRQSAPNLMSVFDRPPRMAEEDPYSLPGAVPRQQPQLPPQQLHGRESKPPKLPPRDLPRVSVPRPDYEDVEPINRPPPSNNNRKKSPGLYDDPYYCGFRARVPNFAKRGQEPGPHTASGPIGGGPMPRSHSQNYLSLFQKGPSDRSLYDSAYGSCSTDTHHTPVGGGFSAGSGGSSGDDDYSKIYGRIRGAPSGPQRQQQQQQPLASRLPPPLPQPRSSRSLPTGAVPPQPPPAWKPHKRSALYGRVRAVFSPRKQ
ncbi:hypothetical protein HPB48_014692 [Haemaphysalis longicornis]|uniref:MH2 domain-containing protein n=1 Tax=Haemaphysalis longicornis TaxID=44386 RepID=A0A9J6G2E8_HAELO|nr:hypothetical protein HPB48_014692 [Haemaphysalis longicornis]